MQAFEGPGKKGLEEPGFPEQIGGRCEGLHVRCKKRGAAGVEEQRRVWVGLGQESQQRPACWGAASLTRGRLGPEDPFSLAQVGFMGLGVPLTGGQS